jgi:DNA-binding NtrC family response regulator
MSMSSKVLIVDDDAAMCVMLASNLGRRGFEVTCHQTAERAFEALRAQDFDVVVTDLNMRGMNGLELCERVMADRPDVPVVVITAFGSLDTAIASIRAGAYDFVPKVDRPVAVFCDVLRNAALTEGRSVHGPPMIKPAYIGHERCCGLAA